MRSSLCSIVNCENPRKPLGRGYRGQPPHMSWCPALALQCPGHSPGRVYLLGRPQSSTSAPASGSTGGAAVCAFFSPLCRLPHRACQVRYTPVHQPEAKNWVCLTISVRIWASLCALALLFPEAGRACGTRSGLCPPYLLTPKAESVGLRAGFGGKRQTHLSRSTGSAP